MNVEAETNILLCEQNWKINVGVESYCVEISKCFFHVFFAGINGQLKIRERHFSTRT